MAEDGQLAHEVLLRSVIQGNLSSVIEAAHRVLNVPVMVISASLRVLKACPAGDTGDELFDALIDHGEVSTEAFHIFRRSRVFKVESHAEILEIKQWKDCSAHPCIVAGFGMRDELLGYVLIMADFDELQEKCKVSNDFVRLLCEALSVVMLKGSQYNLSKSAEKLHAIRVLLAGSISTEEELEELKEVIGFPPNTGYILVMAQPNLCSNNNLSVMRRMSKTVCAAYPYVLSYVFGKQTYFLFGNIVGHSGPGYDEVERTIGYLSANNISCGVSSVFHDILATSTMKKQAEVAYIAGKKLDPTNYVHRFSDSVIHCIAYELSLLDYCHIFVSDVFDTLVRYDALHNAQYLETLLAYIRNNRDKVKTGECLRLHRTSMAYRLKKIEEICEVDLNDDATYSHLLISCVLLELRPNLLNALKEGAVDGKNLSVLRGMNS